MAARQDRERLRYIGGRNFIESIVYSLTFLNFQHKLETGIDNLEFLALELERQLCGLARAMPQLKKIYHDFVRDTMEEMYKNYPLPDMGEQCSVWDLLVEWFDKNKEAIFKEWVMIDYNEVQRNIRSQVARIVYESVMGALYRAGVISH